MNRLLKFFLLFLPILGFCESQLLIKFYISDDYKPFISTYKEYVSKLSKDSNAAISIVFDVENDTKEKIYKDFSFSKNTTVNFIHYSSKTDGLNDLSYIEDEFDLVMYGHPSFYPVVKDYDTTIISSMNDNYPKLDGILHLTSQGIKEINHLPVVGKNYLKNHLSLYPSGYKAHFYDFEMTLISSLKNQSKFLDLKLFNFFPDSEKLEQLWKFTDIRYAAFDPDLLSDFNRLVSRFCQGFDFKLKKEGVITLSTSHIFPSQSTPKWSILIPTVEKRHHVFYRLLSSLILQMQITGNLENVELVFCLDNCEMNIGEKRNLLLSSAKGDYISFIDDDDEVSLDYISSIMKRLEKKPDMVEIVLLKENVPSKYNKGYLGSTRLAEFKRQGYQVAFFSHLNPIKRSIALKVQFPRKDYAEDLEWAHNILKTKLIKTKESFLKPSYFYHFNPSESLTYSKEFSKN